MFLNTGRIIGLFPLILLAVGCATANRKPAAAFAPPPADNSIPSQSVNAATPVNFGTAFVAPRGAGNVEDLAVGEKIREMLMDDRTLAPPPSNVITVVSKGVVTMKGFVRSRRAAYELHERISHLPGVQSVQDELTLWNGHKI